MIFWKEWRETRFAFLMSLFFMTGLYYSIPITRTLDDEYWIGVFLVFFGMGYAIVMGAGAFSAEVGEDTLSFLIARPVSRKRVLAAKYLVRGGEAAFIYLVPMAALILTDSGVINFAAKILNTFYPPIVAHPFFKAHWNPVQEWMWVPPHVVQQYILFSLLVVLFIFSCSFLCSVILPRRGLATLGGTLLAAIYFSLQGMPVMGKIRVFDQIGGEIVFLLLLCAIAFSTAWFLFRRKEY